MNFPNHTDFQFVDLTCWVVQGVEFKMESRSTASLTALPFLIQYTHTHIYIYIYVCVCVCVYTYMCVCVCVCVCVL